MLLQSSRNPVQVVFDARPHHSVKISYTSATFTRTFLLPAFPLFCTSHAGRIPSIPSPSIVYSPALKTSFSSNLTIALMNSFNLLFNSTASGRPIGPIPIFVVVKPSSFGAGSQSLVVV